MQDSNVMTVGTFMCSPVDHPAVAYPGQLLDVEKAFDHCSAFSWFSANWTLCYYCIAAYLVAIWAGREYMKSRPPFQLRGALLIWNVALACFSILSSWRLVAAITNDLQMYGLTGSLCGMNTLESRQAMALWNFLFSISKIVEFGDTAFIVLRKTPLLFLHWYHHVSVTFFAWSPGAYASPMQTYFTALNTTVHSFMYSYFALKVLRVPLPKAVSMAVTSLQVLQMAAGIFLVVYSYTVKAADPSCILPHQAITIAASIYFSYFVLFLNFFFRAYVQGKRAKPEGNGSCKKLM